MPSGLPFAVCKNNIQNCSHGFDDGFSFHDIKEPSKLDIPLERIRLSKNRKSFQNRPLFLMPYYMSMLDGIGKL